MVALSSPCSATVAAIYAAYEANQDTGFRAHLGASIIGTECERALWYSFRWATRATFDGRMLRLFDRGQREEARFVADLRSIGCEVWEVDENGRQFVCRDDTGHFGGSADGFALGVPEAPKTAHAVEIKTHNAKSFAKLKADGVQKAKPLHYAQMQTYCHMFGVTRALYLAVCKDTDELYSERVRYDAEFAGRLMDKAKRIINAAEPPARAYNDPSFYMCKFCDHRDTCWGNKLPEPTCRSCIHSTPVAGGEWHCNHHGRAMGDAEQEEACPAHLYIPATVNGEQVDACPDGTWISYRMKNGETWVNEVQA